MEKYASAFVAFGGLTALGGFIDLMVRNGEKKRLSDWMVEWWVRFNDVKWSNFGPKESSEAILILDHWADKSLWSFKRWRAVAVVSIVCLVTAACWLSVEQTIRDAWFYRDRPTMPLVEKFWLDSTTSEWVAALAGMLGCSIAFALSSRAR